jgi:hypothetical protein
LLENAIAKQAREATCVLAFFTIAAWGRIGEKNPAFLAPFDHDGLAADLKFPHRLP